MWIIISQNLSVLTYCKTRPELLLCRERDCPRSSESPPKSVSSFGERLSEERRAPSCRSTFASFDVSRSCRRTTEDSRSGSVSTRDSNRRPRSAIARAAAWACSCFGAKGWELRIGKLSSEKSRCNTSYPLLSRHRLVCNLLKNIIEHLSNFDIIMCCKLTKMKK